MLKTTSKQATVLSYYLNSINVNNCNDIHEFINVNRKYFYNILHDNSFYKKDRQISTRLGSAQQLVSQNEMKNPYPYLEMLKQNLMKLTTCQKQ